MVEKEAIDELLFLKEKLYNGILRNRLGCIDMAISALEKQLPKKLFGNKHNPVIVGDTVSGLCPMCLTEFVCITPRLYAEKGLGYCKECGQKLDWSEI